MSDNFYTTYLQGIPVPVIAIDRQYYVMASFIKLFAADEDRSKGFKVELSLTPGLLQLMAPWAKNLNVPFGNDAEFWPRKDAVKYILYNIITGNYSTREVLVEKLRKLEAHQKHFALIAGFRPINLDMEDEINVVCGEEVTATVVDSKKRKLDDYETPVPKRIRLF
ncbi:hypothetical protein BNJ_00292 [Kaumoebavirus]|uniref:hypothetical protein n=1 Tax=Kaumoebavirus TaxID=1859492 RepID=UPI0009C3496C|nr:hypothetical protein BNJ_00292 [Kaumoebavirus]ARA72115.1 hypothetical protein BNJ_00292 [Kaumoebavirus]